MSLAIHDQTIRDYIKDQAEKIFKGLAGRTFTRKWSSGICEVEFSPDNHVSVQFNDENDDFLTVRISGSLVRSRYIWSDVRPKPSWSHFNNSTISSFRISYLDGGFSLVFGNVQLMDEIQKRGYGVKLHKVRLEVAKMVQNLSYGQRMSIVATSNADNKPQNRIFEHFEWNKGVLSPNHFIWYKSVDSIK